ncbi:MAG: hypothetical protein KI790_10195 [Cyclobacteriaceae bacterium]|nr:hypothetical protein [Cyclobacteriaceae bacterium HetDA_MAG_MS6]
MIKTVMMEARGLTQAFAILAPTVSTAVQGNVVENLKLVKKVGFLLPFLFVINSCGDFEPVSTAKSESFVYNLFHGNMQDIIKEMAFEAYPSLDTATVLWSLESTRNRLTARHNCDIEIQVDTLFQMSMDGLIKSKYPIKVLIDVKSDLNHDQVQLLYHSKYNKVFNIKIQEQ